MRDGLPYIALCPYTDDKWETLPHIILTSNIDWDPIVLDYEYDDSDTWHDALLDPPPALPHIWFDELGDYHKCLLVQEHFYDVGNRSCVNDTASECVMLHTYHVHLLDMSSPPSPDPADPTLELSPPVMRHMSSTKSQGILLITKHCAQCLDGSL